MLQFFKKTGRRQKDANISTTTTTTIDSLASSSSPSSSSNQQNNLLIKHENNNELCQQQQQRKQQQNHQTNVNIDELLLEAEKYCGITASSSTTNGIIEQENEDEDQTHFSKSILQILTDTNCLSYFIQFLEQQQALPLIKFWLDSESFKQSIVTVFHQNQNNNNNNTSIYDLTLIETKLKDELTKLLLINGKNNNAEERSKMSKSFSLDNTTTTTLNYDKTQCYDTVSEQNSFCDIQEEKQQEHQSKEENDDKISDNLVENDHNIENETVKDSTTILENQNHDVTDFCNIMMEQRPITDDEKSQIYEQNKNFINKQQQHQVESQQNDSDDNFIEYQLSIATDAIRIIRKYFIKNSLYSIDLPTKLIKSMLIKLNSNESIVGCNSSTSVDVSCRQSLNDCDLTENNHNNINDDDDEDVTDNVALTSNNTVTADDSKTNKIPLINNKLIINLFTDAQMFIINKLEQCYLNSFLESTFYYKFTLDILTSDNLRMIDILQNETAIFYFMEFLEQEQEEEQQQKRHYLEFWIAAMNFHKQFYMKLNSMGIIDDDMMVGAVGTATTLNGGDDNLSIDDDEESVDNQSNRMTTAENDMKEIQSDALILYEKYFSLQANENHSLHLSDRIRFTIEEKICSNDARIIINCFNVSMKIIEYYLENKYLLKFKTSTLFYKYLSELLQRVGGSIEDQQHTIDKIEQLKSTKQNNRTLSILNALGTAAAIIPTSTTTNKQYRGHRKTYSDCTSDNTQSLRRSSTVVVDDQSKKQQTINNNNSFLSSQNTLLAMDSKYYNKNNQRKKQSTSGGASTTTGSSNTTTDMQIDSRQLYNPDLLWRRNTISGLTFGRIDSLGRYERDFDWDPLGHNNNNNNNNDFKIQNQQQQPSSSPQITANATSILQSKSNKFKRAVRKLVNLPEDKVQEEMAWQVAEMIIKDITNVTLNNSNSNNLTMTTSKSMGKIEKKNYK